ncbi:unnamed protein product [Ambrosiozyma monospora]|uniref:Unnamed protein product n=1 Tax=Ambrosiozyma monospora TaxID=43982 RepID=A0ACB5U6R3_AMBMO|nr:unnamed protein product [Ambrosiozyma monospora]
MSTEQTTPAPTPAQTPATAASVASADAAPAHSKQGGHSKKAKKQQTFNLKTPKGTKDWADKDMIIREAIFNKLTTLFKSHGGVTIDTPVFELREILADTI